MPTVLLEGLEVKFPYDPYEIQKDLMSAVIKCIQNVSDKVRETVILIRQI